MKPSLFFVLSLILPCNFANALTGKIVTSGMSRDEVRAQEGTPAKELRAGLAEEIWWYGNNKKSCVVEFVKGFAKGPAQCGRADMKFENAEMIVYEREKNETREINEISSLDQEIRNEEKKDRERATLKNISDGIEIARIAFGTSAERVCGPKPDPKLGCTIERCVNEKWEEVCR